MVLHIFADIIAPVVAGVIYFVMARYIKYITPMRILVVGKQTYHGAYWGFLFFGLFLISRPAQIMLGPHPWPLIINNIREFIMIGIFAPAASIGALTFAFGEEKIKPGFVHLIIGFCLFIALIFIMVNIWAIGGSYEIFTIGKYSAYDGLWFHPDNEYSYLMPMLFLLRFLNPVVILVAVGILSLYRAKTFPRTSVYTNLPRKYFLQGCAMITFGSSMLFCGFMFLLWKTPNQWWIYYIGAIMAGVFELIGLHLPLRKEKVL